MSYREQVLELAASNKKAKQSKERTEKATIERVVKALEEFKGLKTIHGQTISLETKPSCREYIATVYLTDTDNRPLMGLGSCGIGIFPHELTGRLLFKTVKCGCFKETFSDLDKAVGSLVEELAKVIDPSH